MSWSQCPRTSSAPQPIASVLHYSDPPPPLPSRIWTSEKYSNRVPVPQAVNHWLWNPVHSSAKTFPKSLLNTERHPACLFTGVCLVHKWVLMYQASQVSCHEETHVCLRTWWFDHHCKKPKRLTGNQNDECNQPLLHLASSQKGFWRGIKILALYKLPVCKPFWGSAHEGHFLQHRVLNWLMSWNME